MTRGTNGYKKIHSSKVPMFWVIFWVALYFVSTGRARAPPCPGWGTVFSSSHPMLSGGRRSCWDSICTALILQARELSQSWEEGEIILWLPLWILLSLFFQKLESYETLLDKSTRFSVTLNIVGLQSPTSHIRIYQISEKSFLWSHKSHYVTFFFHICSSTPQILWTDFDL